VAAQHTAPSRDKNNSQLDIVACSFYILFGENHVCAIVRWD